VIITVLLLLAIGLQLAAAFQARELSGELAAIASDVQAHAAADVQRHRDLADRLARLEMRLDQALRAERRPSRQIGAVAVVEG
jgi:hypothetical protein